MKKLMMAVAIVCAAVGIQAASITWSSAGVQISGDFDEGTGDYLNQGLVCLFASTSYDSVSKAIAGAAADASGAWKTTLSGAVLQTATTDSDGAFSKVLSGVDNATTYSYFMVLFDAASMDNATTAFVTAVSTVNDNSTHAIVMNWDYEGYVNATGSWTSLSGGSVPEPTSGLLLVLGLAGLALRRKQA